MNRFLSFGMKCCSLFWLFLILPFAYGQWTGHSTRKRINSEAQEPEWHTIDLPLDHFDVFNNRTFQGRYLTNDQFYKKGGPIVAYLGGEWEISNYGVMGGVAFQLARKFNGYLFYPEHRYFGKSLPFPRPVSVENLRYLTPDNSLADIMYSLNLVKHSVEGLEQSQVIAIGASYSGTLAIWARVKYPHLIDIVYNCGGVTKSAVLNAGYYDTVYKVYQKVSPKCANILSSGLKEAHEMDKTPKGRVKLENQFSFSAFVCADRSFFTLPHYISMLFNPQVWPVYKVLLICHYIETNTEGTPLERLDQVSKRIEPLDKCPTNENEWFFLVCNYIGNIQGSKESNFGTLFDFQNRMHTSCRKRYGPIFTDDHIYNRTNRTELLFGSNTPAATKILSVQGTGDPWKTASIQDELNDETPVVYIEDATHCLEVGEEQDDETPQVAQAKFEILDQLSKWII